MRLAFKSLTLINFCSFVGEHHFQLDRAPGLYYIQGKNLERPRLGSNGVGKSTLLVNSIFWCITGRTIKSARPGSTIEPWNKIKETTAVTLNLSIDDLDYEIRRSRKPNSLTLNGEIVEQNRINKLLPISDEAILRTFLIGQSGVFFLDLRPEQQSAFFTELLNLGIWIKAADLAAKQSKELAVHANVIEKYLTQADGRLSELGEQIKQLTEQAGSFEETKQKKLVELAEQTKLATDALTTLATMAPTAPRDDRKAGERDEAIAAHHRALLRLGERGRKTALGTAEAIKKIGKLLATIDQNETNLEKYQNAKSICPACGQPVTDDHVESEIARLRVALAKETQDLVGWQAMAKEYEKEAAKQDREKANLENEIQMLRDQTHADTLAETEYQHQKQGLEDKVAQLTKLLDAERNKENVFKGQAVRLKDRREQLRLEKVEKTTQLKSLQKQIASIDYWCTAFKEIRLNLIDDTLIELEFATNRHIENLGLLDWKIQFKTERETASGSVSHKFSVFIHPPDQPAPIDWASFSGGEEQRLQLATTFGLSEVLLARCGMFPNVEILDEPTSHMSQTGIDDLLEHLHTRALELNRALYVVDHHNLSSGAFDGTITIEKREEGSVIIN